MLVPKGALPLVKYQGMNAVHEREVELLNRLYQALKEKRSEEEIDRLIEEFLQDVREHFSYEEDLMRKTRFFAYDCHSEEHRRVLKELEDLRTSWKKTKDAALLERYFEEVFKPWIVEHVLTMDTVTAEWISRTMFGLPAPARG